MATVLLLTHDYQFLNVVSIKKAIKLVVKNRVEVVKNTDRLIHGGMYLPKVIRLLKAVKQSLNKKIPFSKKTVLVRDNHTCQYCGKVLTPKTCTIDHVLPVSKGGKSSYLNCVTACKTCNNWKDDKLLHQTNMTLIKPATHPNFSEYMFFKMRTLGIDLKDIWI